MPFLIALVVVFVAICAALPLVVIGLEVWDAHKIRTGPDHRQYR